RASESQPARPVNVYKDLTLTRFDSDTVSGQALSQPGANAVPFWVRLEFAKGSPGSTGGQTLTAGTLGLRIFGLRELEYAPATLEARFIMQHAFSVSEYLLRSGKRLGDGETIGVDGQARFAIAHADNGEFSPFPVARLSLLPKTQ
ncbi:DUF4261 domain-containing protein, partial [Acidisphaera sp. S103]|uniref:DUF4261 domain-containing protein n=1 Tax=Acidisphaera sp. S103 TaxID=1747223 RepID=UPI00131E50AA